MKQKGFTLFELILVMSISLILLMAAIPSYHHVIFRNRTANVINQLSSAIQLTRQQAISSNQTLEFCGSSDHVQCDGRWQQGQVVRIFSSKQVLRAFSLLRDKEQLWWQSSLGNNNTLKLAPTGFTEGQRGSFFYCSGDKNARYGAKMIVTDSGRVRVEWDDSEIRKVCQELQPPFLI
jgi:prepilin-type N-terminal cleavage/methylation domain-containing protein